MRRRNRILAGVLGAALLAVGSLPVCADNNTLTVEYKKDSSYTLQIPTTLRLSETETVSVGIGLSAINVTPSQKVQIKVQSGVNGGKVTLTEAGSQAQTFSQVSLTENGAGLGDNAVIAKFGMADALLNTSLYFSPLESVPTAGTYSGQIVFSAEIVDDSVKNEP